MKTNRKSHIIICLAHCTKTLATAGVVAVMLMLFTLPQVKAQIAHPADEFTLVLEVEPVEGGTATGGGTYAAGTQLTLIAETAEGFVFDQWSDELGNLLSKNTHFQYTMPAEDVTLTAVFQCSPDWQEATGFQFNMQVIAHIVHEEGVSQNPYDVLGAFVGNECRGYASPKPEYDGLVFLTIGSNTQTGEKVELRIWNNEICEACDAFQNFTFVNQSIIGSLDNPYEVECFEEAVLTLNFQQGYSWFSLNIIQNNMEVNEVFAALDPCSNDRLIGQETFAVYHQNSWIGTLQQFDNEQMYRIRLCSSQSLPLIGARAPILPYELSAGYTWIGYLPQQCLPVNQALAGLDPAPEFNDRIIGHNDFAVYTGTNWVGSLQQMCPGKGYIIKLANNSILSYPDDRQMNASVNATANKPANNKDATYIPPRNLQHTMMVVARILDEKGQTLLHPDDILYAFIDGQCRGMASPDPELDGLVFMNIGEDSVNRKEVSFKLWSAEQNELTGLKQRIIFEPLSEAGSLHNPLLLIKDLQDVGLAENRIEAPAPNPFVAQTTLHYRLSDAGRIHLRLFNSMGQLVRQMEEVKGTGGNYSLLIDRETLRPGVYWLVTGLHTASSSAQRTFSLIVE